MSDEILQAPEYLSPSSIGTFRQCPLQFKLSRIDKIEQLPTEETLLGNFVHDVLEVFYSVSPEDRTIGTVKALSATIWNEYGWQEKVEPYLKKMSLNSFRWNAWWCIENLFRIEDPLQTFPSGIEDEVIGEISGVKMRGFIDRWADNGEEISISDYKTGKTPQAKYSKPKFFQLVVYAHLLGAMKNKPVTNLNLLYLKDGTHLQMSPTQEEMEEVAVTVRSVKDDIDARCISGQWEAVPSILCDWCSYKKTICTYWNKK